MSLLIATDHTFIRHPSGIYDTFCFYRSFFEDYCQVFKTIEVISRVSDQEIIPPGSVRSDGAGVRFTGVSNLRGFQWIARSRDVSNKHLDTALAHADALVVRVPSQLGWWAAKRAIQLRKPYMIEVTGDPKRTVTNAGGGPHYWLIAQLEAYRLKHIAKYACVASYVSQFYLPKTYPVPPGTPADSISSIRLESREITHPRIFDSRSGNLRVILVASLFTYKRHIDILRACHMALKKGVEVEAHFVGEGPMRSELDALAQRLNIREKIYFHGHIANRCVLKKLLDSSDLFVMSSASEGLPRAVLEAMARGLPVIGTQTPGVEELLRPSELYPVGDFRALAGLLLNLARNPRLLNEISQHSIAVVGQYTRDVLSPKRVRLYKLLMEKATPCP